MISIYDSLAKVLYDDERGVEYSPLRCMNDQVIANRIKNPNAIEAIYCISASAKLNSDMAVNLRTMLVEREIDLLIPKEDGINEIRKYVPSYDSLDPESQVWFEKPYLETMFLLNELINLEYEKLPNTGIIRIREQSGMMKDRYSSLAMGCYFVSMLARDLLGYDEEVDYSNAPSCVSTIKF